MTNSPFVAAFFAFNGAMVKNDNVAIYAYLENIGVKITSSDKPWIRILGPNVRTHKRHFFQQSRYTICKEISNGKVLYASHEKAIGDGNDSQDIVWKFIVPAEEQRIAFKRLELMNINAYSLFGSEESLMSTLAVREFKLK